MASDVHMDVASLFAEILVQAGLDLLVAAVKLGDKSDVKERDAIVHVLNVAPLLCIQAAAAMRGSPCYAAVMFYERTRRCRAPERSSAAASWGGSARCFFNGLPRSLPMFGAPVAIQFPVERMRELAFSDVINERLHTVSKLETFADGSPSLKELADQFDHLPDLSAEVPRRVRIFVSRTRTMCEGMRACKPAALFRQCGHEQCLRLFMMDKIDGCSNQSGLRPGHEYWEEISQQPMYGHDECRFCSAQCAEQWRAQMDGLLASTVDRPGTLLQQLHGHDATRDIGINIHGGRRPCSVRTELDYALRRNSQLNMAIMKLHRRRRKMAPAVSRGDVEREARVRVVRANVDLGLLHATAKASGIKRWRQRRAFPGETWQWRDEEEAVSMARRALLLYNENTSDTPIHDMLTGHRFLRHCASRVRFLLKIA